MSKRVKLSRLVSRKLPESYVQAVFSSFLDPSFHPFPLLFYSFPLFSFILDVIHNLSMSIDLFSAHLASCLAIELLQNFNGKTECPQSVLIYSRIVLSEQWELALKRGQTPSPSVVKLQAGSKGILTCPKF